MNRVILFLLFKPDQNKYWQTLSKRLSMVCVWICKLNLSEWHHFSYGYKYSHPNSTEDQTKSQVFNCKWADSWAVSVCFVAKLLQRLYNHETIIIFKHTYEFFFEKSSSRSNIKLDWYHLRQHCSMVTLVLFPISFPCIVYKASYGQWEGCMRMKILLNTIIAETQHFCNYFNYTLVKQESSHIS